MFKIALIGTGYIGRTHGLAYNNVNRVFPDTPPLKCQLVVDNNESAAKKFAQEFGFENFSTDWKDATDSDDVDIVAIAAPNFLHKEIAVRALENGKHVYCEKPLSTNIEDAELMLTAANMSKGKTLAGYNYICNPIVQLAARLLKEGEIGRPYFFRGVNDEDYMADPNLPFTWRCEKEKAGFGVLGDLKTHLINLAQYLMGDITEVTGQIFTAHEFRRPENSNAKRRVENEDIASSIVTFRNGAKGELSSSRSAWGRKNRLAFEIHGDNGMISFDQEKMNEIEVYKNDGPEHLRGFRRVLASPSHEPYSAFIQSAGHQLGFNDLKTIEIRNLLQGLVGDLPLYPTFTDAIKTERVIDAVLQSAQSGRITTVKS